MGLFDTLLGRTKPVQANLDALFNLPNAAITLQVTSGLLPTGRAGVCFKPPSGQPFAEMQAELERLLTTPDDNGPGAPAPPGATVPGAATSSPPAPTAPGAPATPTVRHVGDKFGYRWIIVEASAVDDLVTRVHMVHSSLQDAGWSTQLLCSVFGFAPGPAQGSGDASDMGAPEASGASADAITRPLYLVYLAKQGTFYPFAPTGPEQRDNELELRLKGMLSEDLPIEPDLSRWFPMWDLPIA
jgi:PspAB-like protein